MNDVGVNISDAFGNFFFSNNFSDNVVNAVDSCNNSWDDGYPSGGNYWDDYSGIDIYNGPSQVIPGSDGIGDTPYSVSGGSNVDRYPFMNPVGSSIVYVWVDG